MSAMSTGVVSADLLVRSLPWELLEWGAGRCTARRGAMARVSLGPLTSPLPPRHKRADPAEGRDPRHQPDDL